MRAGAFTWVHGRLGLGAGAGFGSGMNVSERWLYETETETAEVVEPPWIDGRGQALGQETSE
ncbi:hypothetical protein SALBM135S_00196 [Streptomyces alboniger]